MPRARPWAIGLVALLALAEARAAPVASAGPAELRRRAQALSGGLASGGDAARLVESADALGALVRRAGELEADAATFSALASTGEQISAAAAGERTEREQACGEDEAALEALYRSLAWQQLGYARFNAAYWLGWSQLGLARALDAGPRRDAALAAARAAFSRSARALALPEIAEGSLLGLGQVHLERGDLARARALLERVEATQRSRGGEPDVATLRALAALYTRQGELDRAFAAASQIPEQRLTPAERAELRTLEAEQALEALRRGEGDPERAAEALRALGDSGGEASLRASELAARYRDELAGRDIGPVGELLAADEAFAAERFDAARDGYARVLASPQRVAGLDVDRARYRYGVSLYRTGDPAGAARELERAYGDGKTAVARDAALLWYAVAEQRVASTPSRSTRADAGRAARALLRVAPESDAADRARLRLAERLEAKGDTRGALRELEQISDGSDAAALAQLDRIRLGAAALQRAENAGRRPARAQARRLAAELDAAELPELDPATRASLAVLRAKLADWSGEPPAAVRQRIAEARGLSQDAAARRSLLRLELRSAARARDFAAADALLDARSDAEIRGDWSLYAEAQRELERAGAPFATSERWTARLEPLAPAASLADYRLRHAQRLLDAGRPESAAEIAGALVEADRSWADARLVQARALSAAGSPEASGAWETLAVSLEEGSPPWIEAQRAVALLASESGDTETACAAVEALAGAGAEPDARLAEVRDGCPEAGR